MSPGDIDASGRRVALSIAAGRVALGTLAILGTGPTLRALGSDAADPGGRLLAKLLGGRDIAFGLVTLAARDQPAALGRLTLAGVALDAADVVSSAVAARDPGARAAGLGSAASATAAALAGAWAWRQIEQ
jgi:hypothetical protein